MRESHLRSQLQQESRKRIDAVLASADRRSEDIAIFAIVVTELEFRDVQRQILYDAKAMERAVLDTAKGEATGAMHQAVMQRLFFIAKNGWDAYCIKLREPDDQQ